MYKRIPVRKLTGHEAFSNTGLRKFSVLEFWQYGFSSLNSNVLRGALAEFIVENALKTNHEIDVRSPWGNYDVELGSTKIEVKSCSYIQDWDQDKFTTIKWTGFKAKKLYYSEAVQKHSELSQIPDYKADVYVLTLFKHQEHATLDILNMDQWSFYVLSKDRLREITGNGSSISLARLEKLGIEPVGFNDLPAAIKV